MQIRNDRSSPQRLRRLASKTDNQRIKRTCACSTPTSLGLVRKDTTTRFRGIKCEDYGRRCLIVMMPRSPSLITASILRLCGLHKFSLYNHDMHKVYCAQLYALVRVISNCLWATLSPITAVAPVSCPSIFLNALAKLFYLAINYNLVCLNRLRRLCGVLIVSNTVRQHYRTMRTLWNSNNVEGRDRPRLHAIK
jgi:hypothetical protein